MENLYTLVEALLILSLCAEEASARLLKTARNIAEARRILRENNLP